MKKSKKLLSALFLLGMAALLVACSSSKAGGGACDAGGCNAGYGLVTVHVE